eukprot:1196370-Prorocentrum_minimum.AAC.7
MLYVCSSEDGDERECPFVYPQVAESRRIDIAAAQSLKDKLALSNSLAQRFQRNVDDAGPRPGEAPHSGSHVLLHFGWGGGAVRRGHDAVEELSRQSGIPRTPKH